MLSFAQKSILLYALFTISLATAQSTDRYDPVAEQTTRAAYVQSTRLPTEMAFVNTVKLIQNMYEDDPETTVEWIQIKTGLDEAKVLEIVNRMITADTAIDNDNNAASQQLACNHGVPRVSGENVYATFEEIDDEQERIAARHLKTFQEDIGPEASARVTQWIQTRKQNITYIKFDQEKHHTRLGANPDAEISRLCNDLARK